MCLTRRPSLYIAFLRYSLFCCVDESVSQETGKYYADCAAAEPSPNALISSDSRGLWELGAEINGTSHLDAWVNNVYHIDFIQKTLIIYECIKMYAHTHTHLACRVTISLRISLYLLYYCLVKMSYVLETRKALSFTHWRHVGVSCRHVRSDPVLDLPAVPIIKVLITTNHQLINCWLEYSSDHEIQFWVSRLTDYFIT